MALIICPECGPLLLALVARELGSVLINLVVRDPARDYACVEGVFFMQQAMQKSGVVNPIHRGISPTGQGESTA